MAERPHAVDETRIEAWLVEQVADLLALDHDEVDPRQPLADLGLNSIAAVTLTGDLERWLDLDLPPTLAWEHPTIHDLARFLAAQVAEG